jgi:phasin family protein
VTTKPELLHSRRKCLVGAAAILGAPLAWTQNRTLRIVVPFPTSKERLMAESPNPFVEMSKFLAQFQVPGLDAGALNESHKKDLHALVEANRISIEGMQALAQKQLEVFQSTMTELQAMTPSLSVGTSAAPDVAKQGQAAQKVWQKAMSDMRDLAELARKSQTDALVTIAQRATQNLQDLRRLRSLDGKPAMPSVAGLPDEYLQGFMKSGEALWGAFVRQYGLDNGTIGGLPPLPLNKLSSMQNIHAGYWQQQIALWASLVARAAGHLQ